jgi:hypothetical protein
VLPTCLLGLILLLAAGCRRGPQSPPADLPPDPGYQRVRSPGLGFSVDLPRRWRVVSHGPRRATLRQPARPGPRFQLLELAPRRGGSPPMGWTVNEAEPAVLAALGAGGAPLHVLTREDQRTSWLPGRLLQAEGREKKRSRLWAIWIAVHRGQVYALATAGQPADQLELREALDHASATLRPGPS